MAIQHSAITDPDIHEPKGVESATLGQVYAANGAGSGTWHIIDPRGSVIFSNIAAPLTTSYPSSYTKVAPTTTASGFPREVTEATTGRLTYTGTTTKPVRITANLFISQASGANRDIRIAIYKNGAIVASSEGQISTITATKANLVTFADVLATQNDYFEIYIRNDGASGDVLTYNYFLGLSGLGIQ